MTRFLALFGLLEAFGLCEVFGLLEFAGFWALAGVVACGHDGARGCGWVTRGRASLRPGRRRLVRFAAGLVKKLRRVLDPGSLGASRGGRDYITSH